MAFGAIGSFVTGRSHKTSSSTWTFTTTAQLTAGELGVLVIALDNVFSGNGVTTLVSSVADEAGNTWIKAREFTNGQGAAGAGATVSVWYTKATATLASGGNITVTLENATTAKAAVGYRFSVDESVAVGAGTDREDDGVDPGPMSLTVVNREWLFVRGIAGETNSTAALTATSGFTSIGSSQTSGGGAATNMAARGEFRIVTATSQTSDPTWAAADHANVFVAFYEFTPKSASDSGSGSDAAGFPQALISGFDSGGAQTGGATGWLRGGTAENIDSGFTAWTNPQDAIEADQAFSYVDHSSAVFSDRLCVRNYNASVTGDIAGVEVEISHYLNLDSNHQAALYLTKDGSNPVGSAKYVPHSPVYNVLVLGGPNDTWGATISQSEAQNANFGVLAVVEPEAIGTSVWNVDSLRVKLYFHSQNESASVTTDSASKSGADSGSGTDASSIAAHIPVSEAGSGADSSALVVQQFAAESGVGADQASIRVPAVESSTGSDVATLSANIPSVDSGSGSDAIDYKASVAFDSGSGIDSATPAASVSVQESGTASAEVAAVSILIGAADAGLGSDAATLSAWIPAADSGPGADVVTYKASVDFDSGSGVDSGSLVAPIFSQESGTASVEVAAVSASIGVADASLGLDAATLSVWIQVADSGPGADVATHKASVAFETGSGSDVSSLSASVSAQDAGGLSAENATVSIAIFGTDLGSGADFIEHRASSVSEQGAGSDDVTHRAINSWESGAGADSVAYKASVVFESGVGSDTAFVAAFYDVQDAGTASDQGSVSFGDQYFPSSSDSGVGLDTAYVILHVAVVDASISTQDVAALSAHINPNDAGSASEVAATVASIYAPDNGIGYGSGSVGYLASSSDSGLGSDSGLLLASIGALDSGVGAEAIGPRLFASADLGVGTESLGTRTLGAADLVYGIDGADSDWRLSLAAGDGLDLTVAPLSTPALSLAPAPSRTLSPAPAVSESLAQAQEDELTLTPTDYSPL